MPIIWGPLPLFEGTRKVLAGFRYSCTQTSKTRTTATTTKKHLVNQTEKKRKHTAAAAISRSCHNRTNQEFMLLAWLLARLNPKPLNPKPLNPKAYWLSSGSLPGSSCNSFDIVCAALLKRSQHDFASSTRWTCSGQPEAAAEVRNTGYIQRGYSLSGTPRDTRSSPPAGSECSPNRKLWAAGENKEV